MGQIGPAAYPDVRLALSRGGCPMPAGGAPGWSVSLFPAPCLLVGLLTGRSLHGLLCMIHLVQLMGRDNSKQAGD